MDNLQKDTEYKIEVGETISNNNTSSSNTEYHSLFFNFKPKTLKENNWEGSFDIDSSVVDSYTSASPATLTANSKFVFKGSYVPNNKSNVHECVLIYDRYSGTFRLEKLKATTGFTNLVDTSNPPPSLAHSSSTGKLKTAGITETIVPSNRSVQLLGQPKQTTPPKKVTPPPNNLDIDGPISKKRKEETILPPIVMSQQQQQQPISMMSMATTQHLPPRPMGLGQKPGEIDAKAALDDSSASDDSDSSDSDTSSDDTSDDSDSSSDESD
ncbi:predicted protein [Naegleria gruberi]|uniref:Predicted protein n=1 Tax=Naegleria gruberi TaxID=5762 RepID=D2W276_NAEGR|nr:uncharacterized protein NAEGRDRAFT_82109 [Naegleria gruberi]EFC36818.1 predicted protein [Naegleria gruberi]|eukprot:XP_002669562.1 predicted protein [Naegleria gruberi strain NEG-M]